MTRELKPPIPYIALCNASGKLMKATHELLAARHHLENLNEKLAKIDTDAALDAARQAWVELDHASHTLEIRACPPRSKRIAQFQKEVQRAKQKRPAVRGHNSRKAPVRK